MLIDMHVHTRFSPCSVIRIRNLLSRAREVGIDGVCITDHDTIASKHEFEKLSDTHGICFIIGIEYGAEDLIRELRHGSYKPSGRGFF